MSRSGYTDDCEDVLALGRWRAAVRSAMRGRRGQAFLKELLAALDAMPDKRLIINSLKIDGDQIRYGDPEIIVGGDELVDGGGHVAPMGAVCALGAIGEARGMDMSGLDPHESEMIADAFGIARAMACEIVYYNDECGSSRETPEERWVRMRKWVESRIRKDDKPRLDGAPNLL